MSEEKKNTNHKYKDTKRRKTAKATEKTKVDRENPKLTQQKFSKNKNKTNKPREIKNKIFKKKTI